VFGPVWSVLFVLMGTAAWLVWRQGGLDAARGPLLLFALQLSLNLSWSLVFFGLRQPGWAFAELCVLWVAIVATTVAFLRQSSWAGVLMLPYVGWTTFAGVLNVAIWRLNA
jgi:tryptophan-rich sensory protein